MKIIRGDNVTKYIHDDGSETVIKVTPSKEYHYLLGGFVESSVNRNKYSILISSSVGCQMGCKMCGISPKTYKYLSPEQIITNVKNAVAHHDFFVKSLSEMYAKLCFMGMGEATLESTNFNKVPGALTRFLVNKGFAKGVDSIDYGTILPKNRDKDWVERVITLNSVIKDQYPINPTNFHESVVRIFFSLHKMNYDSRRLIIPMGDDDTLDLVELIDSNIEVIMHYTFIDGVNDYQDDIDRLYEFFIKRPYLQLRILRYNSNGAFKESERRELCWKALTDIPNIKFQISPGKEVNSACGQFY